MGPSDAGHDDGDGSKVEDDQDVGESTQQATAAETEKQAKTGGVNHDDHDDDEHTSLPTNEDKQSTKERPFVHSRQDSTKSLKRSEEDATLAALAAASSSSLPISPSSENLASQGIDDSVPSFMLVARLRAQITDLTSQVTSLNTKLVRSFTTTGDLEDELHEVRNRETALKKRLADLEENNKRWEREIEGGGWIERDHVQGEMQRLMTQVLAETASRETAVQAHSALETEIDSLTSTLFEEANKMVVHERIARAKAEEKMRSLDEQSQAMQVVMDAVQINLRETVTRLEQKESEVRFLRKRIVDAGGSLDVDQSEKEATVSKASSIAGNAVEGDPTAVVVSDGVRLTPVIGSDGPNAILQSSPKLDLAAPRLLNSVLPYHEFISFVTYLRQLRVTTLSRPLESPSYSHTLSTRSFSGTPMTISNNPPPNPTQLLAPHLPLSTHLSQPFLKRCVEEDSDPSLRLDLAPGLGFLSRRTVAQSIYDGQLVIEPLSSGSILPSANCAMCGTSLERWNAGNAVAKPSLLPTNAATSTMRKVWGSSSWITGNSSSVAKEESSSTSNSGTSTPTHSEHPSNDYSLPQPTTLDGRRLQIHIFRTSDLPSSNKYPICPLYCLNRLRSVCEFWTYLRALERGLLVEQGFKFVRGKGVESNQKVSEEELLSEKLEDKMGLGLSEESERANEADNDGPTESEATKEVRTGKEEEKDGSNGDEDDKDEFVDTHDDDGAEADDEKKDAPAETTASAEASSDQATDDKASAPSSPTLVRPPVPKRSAARSPVLSTSSTLASDRPKSPTPREGPQAFDSQKLPPRPPPRHPSTHPSKSADSSSTPTKSVEEILNAEPGWEDTCWSEVVRLKEAVFWTRVAAFDRNGEPPEARTLLVGGIQS